MRQAGSVVLLREVRDDDLDALFAHQADAGAAAMADFPSRDRAAFDAHWVRIRADLRCLTRVVEVDGVVAGNVGVWDGDGGRELGYWIGREHWGRGVATAAVGLVLEVEPVRPLHAHVAAHNLGSLRVLERNGFTEVTRGPDGVELVLR